jgi:F420-non-reducing hydrogenase small subunit
VRIALVSLSSCLGCQMVILSLEDYFFSLISENNVSYAPFIIDQKELPEVDLVMVEGTVRNGYDFRKAREARERAQKLVALGTCACFGGVQGLADMFSEQRMIRRRFGRDASFEDAPPGVKRLLPLDSYVAVDSFVPGCPPSPELLKSFMEFALSGTLPSREGLTVCSECNVTSVDLPQPGPRRTTDAIPVSGKCLLEQGFICMGPLTRDGCGAYCPTELGIPCGGCRGPSDAALSSPQYDLRKETIRRLARATGMKPNEVEKAIKDPAHSFFKHCLAEPLLRRRRPGGTSSFLYRLGEMEER